ncbi:MAG: phage holin family protein [Cystobacterineae bacterium]|nr:phage holin family protein [Cystobacterineae bacterium]
MASETGAFLSFLRKTGAYFARFSAKLGFMAVRESIKNLLESLSFLLEQHFKLFQKEFSDELRTLLGSFFGLLLCLLPLLFGYVFVNIGLVFLLNLAMPLWVALLLAGLLNFVLGGLGIWQIGRRLSGLEFLPETLKELFVTRHVLLQGSKPPEQGEFFCEDAACGADDSGIQAKP